MNPVSGAEPDDLKILTAEDILAADDVYYEDVPVPKWGGKVRLRALPAEDLSEYVEQSFETAIGADGKELVKRKISALRSMCLLVSLCAVKADGTKTFTDTNQVGLLAKKDAASLRLCGETAMRINGLSEEHKKALGKDSGGTESSAPGSALLPDSVELSEN